MFREMEILCWWYHRFGYGGEFLGSEFRFWIIDQHGDCGEGELGMRALVIAIRLNRITHVDLFNKKEILYE